MPGIEQNLESLCRLAKESGATSSVSFDARKVVVDERVRLKCCVPLCDDYGLNLMCPPNVIGIEEFREILAKYKHAILVQIEVPITAKMKKEFPRADDLAALYKRDGFLESYRESFTPAKMKLHRIIHKVEAQAFALGYRFAAGFIAGSCKLCVDCAGISSQKVCRHPFRARPSMEAVGIDTVQTAANAGLPFEIPAKNKTVWNGLVLVT